MTPLPQGTAANIRVNLILPESRDVSLHFLLLIAWAYLHSNVRGGFRKRIFSAIECVSAVQGHPRSLILAPIETAYATSY